MGSFPFLNNSIIAEGAKPVEIPDPSVSMQNVLRVQQMRQQNASFPLTQQHLQAQVDEAKANTERIGLANTATQRDMDEEKQTQAELAAAGPDPENIKARALKMTNPKIQATLLKTAGDLETRNATMTAKKHDQYAKQLLGIANNLEAIKKATGPTQLGLWAQEVQDAYALKDEDGKPLIAPGTLDPTTVPPPETLQALQDHVDQFGAFHLQQAKLKDESEKAAKAEQDRVKVAGENLKELHNEAYAALQGADTKESWTRAVSDFAAVDKAHADYAKRFLNVLPYGDGKRALAIVKSRSIPADKQVSEDLTQQERDRQDARDEEIGRHNRAQETNEAARAARERGETANAKAVDRRQNQRDLDKTKEDEERLATLRSNLENAINSGGKTYVDEKGVTKSMTKAVGDEKDTAANLTQRMRSAYQDATNRLKRVTADKNTFGQALGMGITVPTEAIHSALDADSQRVLGPKPTAAAATAQPGAPQGRPAQAPVQAGPAAKTSSATTTPASAGPPQKSNPVSIRLPDGRYLNFPDQGAADKAAAKYGFTITKGQ